MQRAAESQRVLVKPSLLAHRLRTRHMRRIGFLALILAGREFQVVARNTLGEECYASPAMAHGQIFVRTLNHLYCIGERK